MEITGTSNINSILDSRNKSLLGYGYKLLNGPSTSYGMDTVMGESMDIDENRMAVRIPFADGTRRDGVGDLTEVAGIKLDRHEKGRQVLFDHGKVVTLPVALTEDPDTKQYTVFIDPHNRTADAWCFFYRGKGLEGVQRNKEYDHAVFCEQLFDLLTKRFVRGGSFGYQVIKGYPLQPDYEKGLPQGIHLLETLLLELGPVVLPANMDTVLKSKSLGYDPEAAYKILSMPTICGKTISPYLVKSLSGCVDKKAFLGLDGTYDKNPDNDPCPSCPKCDSKDTGHVRSLSGNASCHKCGHIFKDSEYGKKAFEGTQKVPLISVRDYTLDGRGHSDPPHANNAATGNHVKGDGLKGLKSLRQKYGQKGRLRNAFQHVATHVAAIGSAAAYGAAAGHATGVGAGKGALAGAVGGAVSSIAGHVGKRGYNKVKDHIESKQSETESQNRRKGPVEDESETPQFHPQEHYQTRMGKGLVTGKKHNDVNEPCPNTFPNTTREAIIQQQAGQKSMDDLRLKYRKAKGLRRRLRKSVTGSSVMRVHEKDIQKLQGDAKEHGIEIAHLGTVNNLAKLRLTGGDSVIDELARRYGRKGTKAMPPFKLPGYYGEEKDPMRPDMPAVKKRTPGKLTRKPTFKSTLKKKKKYLTKDFPTTRGEASTDWVSSDDYDQRTGGGRGGQFLKNKARNAGYQTRASAKDRTQNPHHPKKQAQEHHDWNEGWDDHHFIHNPESYGKSLKNKALKKTPVPRVHGTSELPDDSGRERLSISPGTLAHSTGGTENIKSMKTKSQPTQSGEPVRKQSIHLAPASTSEADTARVNANIGKVYAGGDSKTPIRTGGRQAAKLGKGIKAMPMNDTMEPEQDIDTPPPDLEAEDHEIPGGEGELEKYSAQVIRQMHADATFLLQHYDGMREHLEHEEIDSTVQKKLENLVEEIEELEGLMSKHHPDVEPLSGAETPEEENEMEDEEEAEEGDEEEGPADSEIDEEPTPDEAVEGMMKPGDKNEKRLSSSEMKSLQNHYKRKSFPKMEQQDEQVEITHPSSNAMLRVSKKKSACSSCKSAGKSKCSCGMKAYDGEHDNTADMGIEGEDKPGFEEFDDKGSFQPHHHRAINEAGEFLDHASKQHEWTDDHQKDAYHHGKTLESVLEEVGGGPNKIGAMDQVDSASGVQEPSSNPQDMPRYGSKMDDWMKSGNATADAMADPVGAITGKSMGDSGAKIGSKVGEHVGRMAGNYVQSKIGKMGKKQIPPQVVEPLISAAVQQSANKGIGGLPGVGDIMGGGGDKSMSDEGEKGLHCAAIHSASKFLKSMAGERAYGEKHRQQALLHSHALRAISQQDDAANVQHPDNETEEGIEPGMMGEKEFPEMERQDSKVQINNPKSPSKVKPGKEPMQQFDNEFGLKSLEAEVKEEAFKQSQQAKELIRQVRLLQGAIQ